MKSAPVFSKHNDSLENGKIDSENANVPSWVKNAAKMLNGGSEGQDWLALAVKLGNILFYSLDSQSDAN